MASTPRPDTGTVVDVAGAGAATASVAPKAPVVAAAPMKWRRSMAMALLNVRSAALQEARPAACAAAGQRIKVNGAVRRAAPAEWLRRRARAPRASCGACSRRGGAVIGDRRDVDELRERRSGSGRFQRAPVDVVAEIPAGIARGPGRHAARCAPRRAGARTARGHAAAACRARSRARPAGSRTHRGTGSIALRARVSIRTNGVRAASPNIRTMSGLCWARSFGRSRSTAA